MAEYIERDALLEDIQAAVDNGGMGAVIAGTLKRYVKRVPAADVVEVKRGRWENIVYNPVLKKMEATCSSCMCRGEIRVKGNCCGFVVPNSDFCPHCGADMREVDDAN